jgi:hypothetical protein
MEPQEIIDIMFQIAFTAKENEWCRKADSEEFAAWIRNQYKQCGLELVPVGSSHGSIST